MTVIPISARTRTKCSADTGSAFLFEPTFTVTGLWISLGRLDDDCAGSGEGITTIRGRDQLRGEDASRRGPGDLLAISTLAHVGSRNRGHRPHRGLASDGALPACRAGRGRQGAAWLVADLRSSRLRAGLIGVATAGLLVPAQAELSGASSRLVDRLGCRRALRSMCRWRSAPPLDAAGRSPPRVARVDRRPDRGRLARPPSRPAPAASAPPFAQLSVVQAANPKQLLARSIVIGSSVCRSARR